ncbi:MAG: helix-turn-helix domain-containing protein [Nanoarchaeota archaeon]|nr:helix-turn-helix domain-containing protein [Nanoarchaeota archaeon]
MDEKLFEKLGLTKGEIKVYLALNKVGQSTITPIAKESKVSKSKIYDILAKLIEKGLVGYVIKSKTKYFMANDPHMILEYLEKQEKDIEQTKEEINKIIPELLLQKSLEKTKRLAEVYEGFQGLKAIRAELISSMKAGEEFLVLGAPKVANEKLEAWFLEFHKNRIKKKITMKIIYNANVREYGKIRAGMKLTDVKYLPNDLVSPNWIDIFPDAILFVMLAENPIAFVVRDKALAESFKAYFKMMWNNSSV